MTGIKGFHTFLIIINCYYLAHLAQVLGQTFDEFEFHSNVYLQSGMGGVDILTYEKYDVGGLFKDDIGQKRTSIFLSVGLGGKVFS